MKKILATLFSSKATAMLTVLVSLLGATKVGAQEPAVSNLDQTTNATNFWVGVDGSGNIERDTFSFTTGTTAASFDFTGVTLKFSDSTGGGGASGLTIGLYSSFNPSLSAGTTGLLADLTLGSGDPASAGLSFFYGSASLAPSTTYFFKISADTTPPGYYYLLTRTLSGSETGLAGWSIQGGLYNWNPSNGGTWSEVGISTGAPQFAVAATEGSAVPEPSTYAAFAGLGVLGFAAWRRRKSVTAPVAA